MNLTIERSALCTGLASIASVVRDNESIPILRAVRLETREGQLILTGTDMSIQVRVAVPAVVSEPGSACVPARELRGLADSYRDGSQISLETDGNHLRVRTGRSSVRFNTVDAADFPEMKQPNDAAELIFGAADLRRAIGAALGA